MSCFTVNTQVTKNVVTPVIKVENIVAAQAAVNKQDIREDVSGVSRDVKVKYEPSDVSAAVHGDFSPDERVSNLILQFILKDLEKHDGYILLSIDELKKVLKVLCKCDDVIIDVEPLTEVKCCLYDYDANEMLSVKKILLKYNNKDCLENFKMHYNEIKILTESYKVDISHVKAALDKA